MGVFFHFDINSEELFHFVHTGQLALGPPRLPPTYPHRPQSFKNVRNLPPHPYMVEMPHHPIFVKNYGWNRVPHPPVSGIHGWGIPIRKDQPHQPTLSIASENVPHNQPNVVATFEETYSSHEKLYRSLVPIHPVPEKQEEPSEQQQEEENTIQPTIDIHPIAKNILDVTSVSKPKPPVRLVSSSRLSFIPKIF